MTPENTNQMLKYVTMRLGHIRKSSGGKEVSALLKDGLLFATFKSIMML